MLFSAHFKTPSIHKDVVGIDGSLVIRINVRFYDYCPFNVHKIYMRSKININQ